jgi:hypothetical protein
MMTRFKLIGFKLCPYVRRAAIALAETGAVAREVGPD